jgi:uncharacterized protein (DUF849 family)
MSDEERLQPIALSPALASLDCGSVNFGEEILPNSLPQMRTYAERMRHAGTKPTLECFDLGHVHNARLLIAEGLLTPPYHFSFVLGVPGSVPADLPTLAPWSPLCRRNRSGAAWHGGAASASSFRPVSCRVATFAWATKTTFTCAKASWRPPTASWLGTPPK